MSDERDNYFKQPNDGIHIVDKGGGGTLLNDELIEIGRQRIAAGEDPNDVALDLALQEVAMLDPDQLAEEGDEPPAEEE